MISLIQSRPLGINVFSGKIQKWRQYQKCERGREFQRLGADRLKALDPMVVRLADGVKSWMIEEDRRVQ